MGKITYGDIDWEGVRGLAFIEAKSAPGRKVRFQDEYGFVDVNYVTGTSPVVIAGLILEASKGYWLERAVLDLTKVSPDANNIGVRIYDEGEDYAEV